jgi:hypothetical protein
MKVLKINTHTEVLCVFIGGNLSEERFSPEPLSKDFLPQIFSLAWHSIIVI